MLINSKAVQLVLITIVFLGQLFTNTAGLKCPSVRVYVRPSIKRFFDFNDIWHVDRGRWVMHDGMQYDPI